MRTADRSSGIRMGMAVVLGLCVTSGTSASSSDGAGLDQLLRDAETDPEVCNDLLSANAS